MQQEPRIPPPRESEALLIAVDTYISNSSNQTTFTTLRDIATRLARTRLVYSFLKDDILCAVASGSSNTRNKLADQTPDGYQGIEILHPPATKSLSTVRVLAPLQQGSVPSNLLNLLDVCGDTLAEPAAQRAVKKRVVILTEGVLLSNSVGKEDVEDFEATCLLYKEHGFQVDVICACADEVEEQLQAVEDETGELGELSVKEWLEKTNNFALSTLFAVCKMTGGVLMSSKEASPLVDRPTPKVKRAMAKYRGTLNIADVLKIPVKRFSFVNEAKHPVGKKISWESSISENQTVSVLVETQRVASTKDDSPLEPNQIVNAYPYGPELVPEPNEVDTTAWSMQLPKGLDVLGFVEQSSVPQRLFMGHVDVVIAMPGVDGAFRLVKSLVLALQAEKLGMLARSVSAARGGPPQLAYLWPRIELDDIGVMRNFFLFIVEIPMREDIRDLPFASLEGPMKEASESAVDAINRYISATMLETNGEESMRDDGEYEDDDKVLWPPSVCNPSLDWFNICIVHRALTGPDGTDLPEKSEWHHKIMDSTSFVREERMETFEKAMQDLKSALSVIPTKKKEKRHKRVHQALRGESASIGDYLPEEDADDNEEIDEDEEMDSDHAPANDFHEFGDELSALSDMDTNDVGEETPIADFHSLVRQNKFNFAAASLLVIIRRLIRDLVDDDKAIECLQALRKTCIRLQKPSPFNGFVINLMRRCKREDATGNRNSAFLRHVGRRNTIAATLIPILPDKPKMKGGSENATGSQSTYLDWVAEQVNAIASNKVSEVSMSTMST